MKPAPPRRLCGCPCGCRVPLFVGEEGICVPCAKGIRINGTHEKLEAAKLEPEPGPVHW